MKKTLLSIILSLSATMGVQAQGWPQQYEGVMLQGFYWDGYADSKWAQLSAQADELSQFFDLIWVPNSGMTSDYYYSKRNTMGYDPCFWLNHTSCWGTEEELKNMIQTFKAKGTGIIEDVVINHKNGLGSWVNFPDENVGDYNITWDNDNYSGICKNDECNTTSNLTKWSTNGKKATGNNDTGDNFDGYRDLDHTNTQVQQNVKVYLNYLLKELGYAGFRYDMVKGYAAKYTGMYNVASNPTFSVGECWDGNKSVVTNWINGTKVDGAIQSAAFDFPLKYKINSALGSGSWKSLGESFLANDESYARYAVTFIDNHDTYRDNNKLARNVCAANAFILTMPGTPCVFLKHWQSNKGTLKRLIALRKAAGINNESKIIATTTYDNGYIHCVQGEKGALTLVLGSPDYGITADQAPVLKGKNFVIYAPLSLNVSAVEAITDEDAIPEDDTLITIPDFCIVGEGETCAFFEAPKNWNTPIKCWRWDKQYNYTGNRWPGVACEKLGVSARGNEVWKWTWDGQKVNQSSTNQGIIFSDVQQVNGSGNQTADLPFVNGGYYTIDGLVGTVTADIAEIPFDTMKSNVLYDLLGRQLRAKPAKGLYIQKHHNRLGKKIIVR